MLDGMMKDCTKKTELISPSQWSFEEQGQCIIEWKEKVLKIVRNNTMLLYENITLALNRLHSLPYIQIEITISVGLVETKIIKNAMSKCHLNAK